MPLSFFSDGHLLLGMGPALKSDLYTQWDLFEENIFFFFYG